MECYYDKYLKYKKKYHKIKNQLYGGFKDNIWIENDFFSNFDIIRNYCMQLDGMLKVDSRSNDRHTLCLDPINHSLIYDAIYDDPKLINYIGKISNSKFKSRPSYPIEYRKYFTGSKGMQWHRDTSLFNPDCFEIVLTIENTSDSKFLYNFIDTKELTPSPNTLVIVRPNTVFHKVTEVTKGYRTILKFVIEFLDDDDNNFKKPEFDSELDSCPF